MTRALPLALGVALLAAPSGAEPTASSCPGSAPPDASLYLIGDAGAPQPGEPALEALARDGARRVSRLGAGRVAVAFLGDNVYPAGIPAEDDSDRAEAEARLGVQLDAVRRARLHGFFVPGNHDWANAGHDGWEAVRRQARLVAASRGPGVATVVPPDGCPGPTHAMLGERMLLLFLDTQWWLHDGPKPRHPGSSCPHDAEAEVVEALGSRLRAAGARHAIVMAHHPLATGGPHGGNFGWREHVFPLRENHRWLWLPLPGLGSLYPIVRGAGVSDQDVMGPGNRRMQRSLAESFAEAPPLVYAAGHDHGLQVIQGGPARWLLVSGGGGSVTLSRVHAIEGTRFARAASGFLRLDARQDGAIRLAALLAQPDGSAREAFGLCLTEGR